MEEASGAICTSSHDNAGRIREGGGRVSVAKKGGQSRKRGQDPKNNGLDCSKAIALPTKDQTTRFEPIQGPVGSF
jgi:hypothetical protein